MTKMKIEYWDIDKLIPYSRNPRRNDDAVPKMAGLIKEFGFKVPVVIRSDGEVIDGHLRLKAARQLGMEQVPVVLADEWTPAQVKAFRLAVNRSAEWAEWDNELLKLELDDLKLEDFDLDLIGFDDVALDDGGTEGLTDPDEVPEVQEKPVTRQGDIWLLGRHRLMCGDSTDAGSVALLMAGEKADITITSPPYGLGDDVAIRKHYKRGQERLKTLYDMHDDDDMSWTDLMQKFFAISQDVSYAQYVNVQMLGANKHHLIDFLAKNNDKLTDVIVWDKGFGAPQMQPNILNNAYEFIFVFDNENKSRTMPFSDFKGNKQNIIRVNRGTNEYADIHKAVFPVSIVDELLDLSMNAKSVFEPFCGTGTTIISCEGKGRSCYGMELSPQYVDCAIRRWQDFTGQESTLEGDGRTFAQIAEERGG